MQLSDFGNDYGNLPRDNLTIGQPLQRGPIRNALTKSNQVLAQSKTLRSSQIGSENSHLTKIYLNANMAS